jgi:hypothetical protein
MKVIGPGTLAIVPGSVHTVAMTDNEPRVFGDIDLSDAVFRETFMPRVRMIGVVLIDADIDGLVQNLTVNGVEVTGYVQAELDRRHPVRPLLRSSDPAELRAGWAGVLADWEATMDRIAALEPEQQHARVADEWSAVETLRHLVFVSDSWFRWSVLGVPKAFHAVGLASPFVPDQEAMGIDPGAHPSFEEVAAIRAGQQREVTDFLAGLTVPDLARHAAAPDRPGWPADPEKHTVLKCLHVLLEEEFAHHSFCVRDLTTLTAGSTA